MVYSSACNVKGGTEEARQVPPINSNKHNDALQDTEILTAPIQPLANKDYDDDEDFSIKLSDLPDDYFDDLLDLDFCAPSNVPTAGQVILLGKK